MIRHPVLDPTEVGGVARHPTDEGLALGRRFEEEVVVVEFVVVEEGVVRRRGPQDGVLAQEEGEGGLVVLVVR